MSSCTISSSFLEPSAPASSSQESSSASLQNICKSSKGTLDHTCAIGKEVLDAEILWALKCMKSHYSFKSCENLEKLFRQMFPDSQIAKMFTCGEKKCAYICSFGLAPYFQATFLKCFKDVHHYTLLFDETLNKTKQQKQMDIHIRFWHDESKEVRTQYLTSDFMGHSTAEDLLKSFYKLTEKLDLSRVLQISMDGPAVNWKFYESLQQDLLLERNIECVSVGSCGLHIMNNAFKKGLEATDWNICSILTSLYWLFKDSPARRADFLEVSSKQKFPKKFCNCRWLENTPVAERAIEIWNDILKYVKNVESGKFSKVACKSFVVVAEATKDRLMLIKLNVFLSVAKILNPFLEMYQNDKPLMPFFADDIFNLTKQCLEQFSVLTAKSIATLSTVEKLIRFDFLDAKNYETKMKVSTGFIGDIILKEKQLKKEVQVGDVLILKFNCQNFILNMLHQLMLKCPINYSLVRNMSCIDPRKMANDAAKSKKKMKEVLLQFSKRKQIPVKDGDEILNEYNNFLEEVVKQSYLEFKNFDVRKDSLDKFFHKTF